MDAPKLPGQRIFDLYLLADKWTATFNEDGRGVSLTDDSVAWISGHRAEMAALTGVVSVRLQFVADNEDFGSFRKCRIEFGDGRRLTVTDWTRTRRGEAAPGYRAFVHDLHNRLVAHGSPSVRYLTGKAPREARIERVVIGALLLFGALITLLSDPTPKNAFGLLLIVLAAVAFLSAMRIDMSKADEYDPTELPEALIVPDEGRLARTR
ncbi:hypothetical protein [Tardiphaga sp. 709]|uniref:hypothetical protein n=1 Tax=Tardiphaga sp. 709 TaxID=3076039 RepID=UPI0028EC7F73|nr:hypothetical protein [Tardiphaga sp. 709]WNV08307.1 hypothetical protein RSO67_22855 [Tardiphaga sp. 709]